MKKSKLNLFNDLVMYTPGNNKRKSFRSTKIIATIKRETSREEILGMITAGMNVARFDASSGKKEDFENIEASLKVFKEVVNECNTSGAIKSENFFVTHIACALDLKGVYLESEIYGKSGDPDVKLSRGDKIIITNHSERETKSTSPSVYINYRNLSKFKLGQPIIINENIHLIVESIERAPLEALICDVVKGGKFVCGERMEVNFPGAKADLDLEAITEDTISAINFCKKNEIDLLFVSVNKPSDLVKINCHVKADGGLHTVKVIAKIECEVVLQFIEMIIEQSDGFMISRACLGRNISPELVTAFQKNVIAECLQAGKPSIVGGDLLESMGKVRNNDATHSEIADVVNLTLDGVDCFMLHETVSTIKVIEFLNSTIMEAEEMVDYQNLHRLLMTQASISSISMVKRDYTNVMAIMACNAAMKNNANAIIALTETGKTAIMLSKYRPECPIIAVTSSSVVARNCLLLRGVLSLNVNLVETDTYERSIEMQTKAAISFIEANHLNKTLTGVAILVMGQRTGSEKLNTIRIIPLQYENSMNDDLKQ